MTTALYSRGASVEEVPAAVKSGRRSKWDSLYEEAKNVEGIVPFILADGKAAGAAAIHLRAKGIKVSTRGSSVYITGA